MKSGKAGTAARNLLLLIVLLITAVVAGGLIAAAAGRVPFLSWLAYSKTLGLGVNHPMLLNLSIIRLAFGLEINISVAQLACMVIVLLLYRKTS